MQEEQAVLEFFARPENLPLALSVAEQTDQLRAQLNSQFWRDLLRHLQTAQLGNKADWQITATDDRNAPDHLVGLYFTPAVEQPIFLRPMMEQQNLGKGLQIYLGLMWSATPTPEQLALPAVRALRDTLKASGYKDNESFLAWQWTTLYPRSQAFLLKYTRRPEQIFAEIEAALDRLMRTHREHISQANAALGSIPRSMTISLDQLRNKRGHQTGLS